MRPFFLIVFAFLFFLLPASFAANSCGNRVCEAALGETKCSCPQDCGICSGAVPGRVCYFYQCDPSNLVCQILAQRPCCGNSDCEIGENFANCSLDCAPKIISVSMIDYYDKKVFLRGDTVVLKAIIRGDGAPLRGGNVSVTGPFGQISLFDDGNHSDERKDDSIYATSFVIGRNFSKDTHSLAIKVEKAGVTFVKNINLIVDPTLDLSTSVSSEQILLGGIFSVKGSLKKRGIPLVQEIKLSAVDENSNSIPGFSKTILSDANGNFSFDYHTSLLEPQGYWTLQAATMDEFGNFAEFEKKIRISSSEKMDFLDLHFLVPAEKLESVFERGEQIKILADLQYNGKPLGAASVSAVLAGKYSVDLLELGDGKYSANFEIPFDFPIGTADVSAVALKEIKKIKYSGSANAKIIVKQAQLKTEVKEPTVSVFAIGETINFVVSIKYASGATATGLDFNSFASDGRKIIFKETVPGTYSASLPVLENDSNGLNITIIAVDAFKNTANRQLPFEILKTKSFLFYFSTDPILVLFLVFLAIVLIAFFVYLFRINKRLGALDKRRSELVKLRGELQDNYFSKGTIDRKEYYSLMAQYTEELERINATIDSISKGRTQKKTEKVVAKEAGAMDKEAEDEPVDLFTVGTPTEEKEEIDLFSFADQKKEGSLEKKKDSEKNE